MIEATVTRTAGVPSRRSRWSSSTQSIIGLPTLAASCDHLRGSLGSILLLDAHPIQAAQTFVHRTLKTQVTRESPFSLWDWAQYHARGIPDLHVLQWVLEGLLVLGAVAAAFFPVPKSPLQLAALTGALLIGFELVLTHWFYLYIPWFLPFVAFAILVPRRASA